VQEIAGSGGHTRRTSRYASLGSRRGIAARWIETSWMAGRRIPMYAESSARRTKVASATAMLNFLVGARRARR